MLQYVQNVYVLIILKQCSNSHCEFCKVSYEQGIQLTNQVHMVKISHCYIGLKS